MGWGTDFTAEIYLSRQIFSSSYELEEHIKDIENSINNIKARILMYSSSNIKDIIPLDLDESPINYIQDIINREFEDLYDKILSLYNLNLYKDSNPKFDKK